MERNFKRGEIYLAQFGEAMNANSSSVQRGLRPVLIVSNDIGNKNGPTVIVAAITSKLMKNHIPTHIKVGRKCGLLRSSLVLTEQLRTMDSSDLMRYIGTLREHEVEKLNEALKVSLGLVRLQEKAEIRTLCSRCAADYEETGQYIVKYAGPHKT